MSRRPLQVLSARAPMLEEPSAPLADRLRAHTISATLFERDARNTLRCTACAHRCVLEEGRTGACGVRFVENQTLRVPHGYVARRYVRSVETNTIYHVRPGARALTFGMFGCDLRCPYCHNWRVSQALREPGSESEAPLVTSAEALVAAAIEAECEVLCAAYNEPMISAEWAHEIFSIAKARGLVTALISDGHSTPEALAYMRDVTDVFRVDLKGNSNEHYKALGARLAPVLESIREAKRMGYWVEVVTLAVPGFSDSLDGLRVTADAILAVSDEIPWHVNAFVPRYRLKERRTTDAMALASAVGMGYARGLKFVYASNLPQSLSELTHTRCPRCHTTLIERTDYVTGARTLTDDGRCPQCYEAIAGLWGSDRRGDYERIEADEMP